MYCRPKYKTSEIHSIIKQVVTKSVGNTHIVVGEFNAAHPLRGYGYTNCRGTELNLAIEERISR
ncbi:hypothetical protein HPB48_021332 [Haemaphysalis longicornis]|uniref:Endonuclease/exonuclease/phosphatase domain-containing protein n=1 Tax=Haemaphysalis longicornis TaxID=44386 RepID=A0A9J6FKW0_HAELO|nr:hypothetical protein HPB48_021332 [Haemaphysalis longicornis]